MRRNRFSFCCIFLLWIGFELQQFLEHPVPKETSRETSLKHPDQLPIPSQPSPLNNNGIYIHLVVSSCPRCSSLQLILAEYLLHYVKTWGQTGTTAAALCCPALTTLKANPAQLLRKYTDTVMKLCFINLPSAFSPIKCCSALTTLSQAWFLSSQQFDTGWSLDLSD